jgi:hypothetical protein
MLLVAFLYEDKVADALVLPKLILSQPVFGDQALGPHVDNELRAHSFLALDFDRASHLLNDLLAYGEAKPSALLVPG